MCVCAHALFCQRGAQWGPDYFDFRLESQGCPLAMPVKCLMNSIKLNTMKAPSDRQFANIRRRTWHWLHQSGQKSHKQTPPPPRPTGFSQWCSHGESWNTEVSPHLNSASFVIPLCQNKVLNNSKFLLYQRCYCFGSFLRRRAHVVMRCFVSPSTLLWRTEHLILSGALRAIMLDLKYLCCVQKKTQNILLLLLLFCVHICTHMLRYSVAFYS